MRNSKISWTDDTWNVTEGCSREMAEGAETSGCGDRTGGGCYAEAMAYRFSGPGQWAEGLVRMTPNGPRWTGKVALRPDKLDHPLRWRGNRLIFVCSTSDPFHEKLSNEEIAAIYGAMAMAPRHTFQMLTKRAKRRREWFAWVTNVAALTKQTIISFCCAMARELAPEGSKIHTTTCTETRWPLPNVWEGASVEHQLAADDRIPDLLHTPAILRFLSIEPMIGPVNLTRLMDDEVGAKWNALATGALHWVIAGCESGHKARAAHVDWYRTLRDQCAEYRVPFFLKQAEHTPGDFVAPATLAVGFDVPLSRVKRRRSEAEHEAGRGDLIELPHLDGRVHADIPGRHLVEVSGDATITPMTWG